VTGIVDDITGNTRRNSSALTAQVARLERLMANSLRLVLASGPALSALAVAELVFVGPTDDFKAGKWAGDDVTILVNPRTEIITVIDPTGKITNAEFHARGGTLDEGQQEQMMGHITRIRVAKKANGIDPVSGVLTLGGEVHEPAAA
jgi:hypothetical protein